MLKTSIISEAKLVLKTVDPLDLLNLPKSMDFMFNLFLLVTHSKSPDSLDLLKSHFTDTSRHHSQNVSLVFTMRSFLQNFEFLRDPKNKHSVTELFVKEEDESESFP